MLTSDEIERMRAEHTPVEAHFDHNGEELDAIRIVCAACSREHDTDDAVVSWPWPCDAARLLEHFAPETHCHCSPGGLSREMCPAHFHHHEMPGVAYGLFGPVTSEELR